MEMAAALGVSQPTLSRFLARFEGPRIHRLGRGKATRYAMARSLGSLGSSWPLYAVAEDGRCQLVGHLHALQAGQWLLEQSSPWKTLRGDAFADGLYPDLPWLLDDLRPQGFLGRAFARKYAGDLGLSADPRSWRADDVVLSLVRYGRDLHGAFVLGEAMLASVQEAMLTAAAPVAAAARPEAYPRLADSMIAGDWPGSSAAGEQPKFTACIRDESGAVRHVIVKFTGKGRRAEDERWGDLLAAEHIAAGLLAEKGLPAAQTSLISAGGRRFIESTRFDRVGAHGRRGLVSLAALDAGFFGQPHTPWTAAATRLSDGGWIGSGDADRMSILWWLGTLIGNTDMHYGNISFVLDANPPLSLAPSYDMLPMHYRPDIEGVLPEGPIKPQPPPPEAMKHWSPASAMAEIFWARAADSPGISEAFRAIAGQNLEVVSRYRQRFIGKE